MEPWIKVERVTANKAQVRKIARRLGVHQMHAFGCCVAFWIYADAEMTEGGVIPLLEPADLDEIVGLEGFSAALVDVRWIAFTPEGAVVQKHDAHMSKHAKARAEGNRRVAEHRERKTKPDTSNVDTTIGGACNEKPLHPCNAESLPEERREEESIDSPNGESCSEVDKPPAEPEPASPEKPKDDAGTVALTTWIFPTVGKQPSWTLPRSKLDEFRKAFPDLDVPKELNTAVGWCEVHVKRRKTPGGMPAFLWSWLSRAQNSGSKHDNRPSQRNGYGKPRRSDELFDPGVVFQGDPEREEARF